MLLSVITINLNNASGLKKTICSVLEQKGREFEYIIVDGASTDDSYDIIQQNTVRKDITVKWISEPDNGVYEAMNKGIRMANGRYVIFMNSGDVFASDDIVDSFVSEDRDADIYYGYVKEFETDRIIRYPDTELNLRTLFSHNIPHQAEFIRRELFYRFGFYSESLKALSDFEFNLKMAIQNVRFSSINKLVACVEPDGISQNLDVIRPEINEIRKTVLPAAVINDYLFFAQNEKKLAFLNGDSFISKCMRVIIHFYKR